MPNMYVNPSPDDKFKWFLLELYPDSADPDWLDQLCLIGKPFAVSPLHDRDIKEDGSPVKPHHHILLNWKAPTTFGYIERLWKSFNQPRPQAVADPIGIFEYLWHKNEVTKAAYNEDDVKFYCKFDVAEVYELTKTEIRYMMDKLATHIKTFHITEYSDLYWSIEDPDMRWVVSSHYGHFKALCDSIRYKDEKKQKS